MLRTLKDLFESIAVPTPSTARTDAEHALQLAAAVLLVEVMRADATIDAAARQAVVAALRDKFELADDEVARLLELAEKASRDATDFFAFTSRLNEGFDDARKLRIVEHMWRVAYADGRLSAHENHLMRRIADLLYIPHGAYIAAKMRAKGETGPA